MSPGSQNRERRGAENPRVCGGDWYSGWVGICVEILPRTTMTN